MKIPGVLLLLGFAFPALGQDAQNGRMLYDTYCGICHYERLHDRPSSKVKSLPELRDEVARWASQTQRRFTLDEREDMVRYLNESHYRFGLPPKASRKGSSKEGK